MTSTLPRISVITPTYNQAGFIEETILSVLEQKYPNLEYLVFDGGSTDGTLEILKKYEQHLRWVSRKDKGQSDALNQGFRQASGEVLAYINSDDRYEPGALLRVGEHMRDHPQVHWLTGRCRLIDPSGREIRRLITAYKNFWLLFGSYASLLVLDYVSQPATFWRRSVIEKVGLFDEDLHLTMDYDYSLRVGQHFRLYPIPAYLAAFRVHPASKSSLVREHFDEDLAIARRYTASRLLRALHSAHNEIIINIYERSSHQAAPKDAPL
jgi:glycosyltransferase involved in cell wall biosynthesis